MKFAVIKRKDDDRYLCTQFSAGTDPYEMTFTPGPYLEKDRTWCELTWVMGTDSSERLVIFESVKAAKEHLGDLPGPVEDYEVVALADFDSIVEEHLLKG